MENKTSLAVPIAIVIAGALIAFAVYSGGGSSEKVADKPAPQAGESVKIKAISSKDHILGNPNAKIKIVEYSDTECPFCKRFHVTLHQIMDEYGADGRVAWVYRHFPIDQLHSKARKEAEATECAAELGGNDKFWEYIDRLYEITPSNNGLDLAELPKIAVAVGLDKTAFEKCLASGRHASKVESDYQDAVRAGGRGTPYSVIVTTKNGNIPITQGALPFEQMKQIIDGVLSAE